MTKRICYLCGNPATGLASEWTAATGERWYCHGDDDAEPTCYERRGWVARPDYTPAEALLIAMKNVRATRPSAKVLAVVEEIEAENTCHCGRVVVNGFNGDPLSTRGMCEHCDSVRCDAYPGECGL